MATQLRVRSLALVLLVAVTGACGSSTGEIPGDEVDAGDETLADADMDSSAVDTGRDDTDNADSSGADTGRADTGRTDTGTADSSGGDTSSAETSTGTDAGGDASADTALATDTDTIGLDAISSDVADAAAEVAADTGPTDPCLTGTNGTACTISGGGSGLCKSTVCSPCVVGTDDAACTTAYGTSTLGSLCIAGACAPAECRVDSDCASIGKAGQICGLVTPNVCGKCSSDVQCTSSSYGPTTICNVTGGACVPASCGTPNTTCSANPADFCCATSSASAACRAGNCCSTAQCTGGAICLSNTCTTCTAVTNNIYYVDPIGGSDTSASGSAACPFRSLSRAVQFIVSAGAAPAGTKIYLMNDSLVANASRNENFPITVPTNVTISSDPAGAVHTVEVTSGRIGFNLGSPSSGLASLAIEGKGAATTGVRAGANASNATTLITSVTVHGFAADGILVESGGLRIGAGVLSTENGQNIGTTNRGAGLDVTGGNVTIVVASGAAKTGFDSNLGNGIVVTAGGSVTITGVPDVTGYPTNANPPAVAAGTGTVTANSNTLANLAIAQSGNARPQNQINGLVTWGGKGNGMNFASGSNVGVRNCVSVKNASSGVRITASFNGAITAAGASINLGPDGLGKNIFQTPTNGNAAAGICIGSFLNQAQTLSARANYFATKDCSAPAVVPAITVTSSLNGCTGGIDVGIERTATNQQQTNIRVALDNCQSL